MIQSLSGRELFLVEVWGDILKEIVKASPLAGMCVAFVFLLNRVYSNHAKELKETYNKSVDDIKEVYEKVYEALNKRVSKK